jgi:hypothetical protein
MPDKIMTIWNIKHSAAAQNASCLNNFSIGLPSILSRYLVVENFHVHLLVTSVDES